MSMPAIDHAMIQGLVAEVLRRIHTQGSARPTAAAPTAPSPSTAPASSYGAPQTVAAGPTLGDRLITAAIVAGLPAGSGRVAIAARAVVTPAAADLARERGIEFVRTATAAAASARAPLPFVIAHSQCRLDAAPRAAAIARAVSGAQQLPATGIAEVVETLAAHASRDGARGILLTSRPAVALILANRSASLRAVTARDLATLNAAIADCGANLLVADPAGFPAGALERLCADFASRQGLTAPAELSQAPAGCGCKSHTH